MASLTETAYVTRRAIVFVGIGFLALLIGRWGFIAFTKYWIAHHPPPPPPPTVAFGVLREPVFPTDKNRSGLTYQLQTISGTVPDFGTQEKVFFMPAFRANVLGLELATALAGRIGFKLAPVQKDEQTYEWKRSGVLPAMLSINLVTGYFTLDTTWLQDAEITSGRSPSTDVAEKTAKGFLQTAGVLALDLGRGKTRIEYMQVTSDGVKPALSQSEANVARVHFFRDDVNKLPVVSSHAAEGLTQVIVTGAKGDKQIASVKYQYSPVELERFATYPLRPSAAVWEQLQQGQGVIAQMADGETAATVRTVELAYYDSEVPQEFLQPVYVFRGDRGFVAYVPAVDPKWLESGSNK